MFDCASLLAVIMNNLSSYHGLDVSLRSSIEYAAASFKWPGATTHMS